MQLRRKLAGISENAGLAALHRFLTWWSRALVAVDTLEVRASAAVNARSHTRDEPQCPNLVRSGLVIVDVCALLAIGTLFTQEVYIAHLDLLNAVDFGLIVIAAVLVHALTGSIACNRLFGKLGFVDRR